MAEITKFMINIPQQVANKQGWKYLLPHLVDKQSPKTNVENIFFMLKNKIEKAQAGNIVWIRISLISFKRLKKNLRFLRRFFYIQ